MRIPHQFCFWLVAESACNFQFRLQFAGSTYSCVFHGSSNLLNTYYDLFVDFTYNFGFRNFCSGFHNICRGIRKVAFLWSDFEQYRDLAICPWNPKQQKRSKKISNIADSTSILFLACCRIRLQFPIPLTICGFHVQLRIPRQLKFIKHICYDLFVDFTYYFGFRNFCSGFHNICRGIRKVAFLWSDFEQYRDLAICPWNPKQQKRSKKISNIADSTSILFLACCRIHLQFPIPLTICGFHVQLRIPRQLKFIKHIL